MQKYDLTISRVLAFIHALAIALLVLLVIGVVSAAHAGETGRSGSRASARPAARPAVRSGSAAAARSAGRPAVTARNDVPTVSTGNLRQNNTGADSIFEVGRLVNRAATDEQHRNAVRNVARTNAARHSNISNLNGCTYITTGHTSCYGSGDGFAGRHTKVGIKYDPNDMTVAFNSWPLLGQIVVARNPTTGVARAMTVTDTGSFGKKYGRVADLSAGAVLDFGLRCSPSSGSMDGIEIYACPNK